MRGFFTLLVGVTTILFTGCDVEDIALNTQQTYALYEEVRAVVVSDGIDVVIDSSLLGNQMLATTNAQDLSNLNIDVVNGTLRLDIRNAVFGTKRYVVYLPSFAYERVEVTGGSGFTWKCCNSAVLSIEASGGSDCEVKGVTRHLDIEASGGSDVDCGGLDAEYVTIEASGGSDVEARASHSLSVTASGGSDIHITGNPQMLHMEVSGGSDMYFN